MNRYKIEMVNKSSGKKSVDVIHADDEAMLTKSVEEMGFGIGKILEVVPIQLNATPPPNLDGLADLGVEIDEAALARQQAQQEFQQSQQLHQPHQMPPGQYNQSIPAPQAPVNPVIEFVDNGISYRVEHGTVYKKDWVEVDPKEFKVVKKESKKPVTDYLVYKLDWVVHEDKK